MAAEGAGAGLAGADPSFEEPAEVPAEADPPSDGFEDGLSPDLGAESPPAFAEADEAGTEPELDLRESFT